MIWTVIGASLAVYTWKLLGYLVPRAWISERFKAFADRVTVLLLAALVGIQGFTSSGELTLDSRVLSLIVAGILLALRVPYILVVLSAAIVAACSRAFLGF